MADKLDKFVRGAHSNVEGLGHTLTSLISTSAPFLICAILSLRIMRSSSVRSMK